MGRRHLDQRWRPLLVAFDEHRTPARQCDVPPDASCPGKCRCGSQRQVLCLVPVGELETDERSVSPGDEGSVIEAVPGPTRYQGPGIQINPASYGTVDQVIHADRLGLQL